MIAATWTQRDFDLVETLCCRVRVLSLDQIRRGWWRNDEHAAVIERQMNRLIHAGLLQNVVWNLQVARFQGEPLFAWNPNGPAPEFEQVTRLVRSRWPHDICSVHAYVASNKAARLFGSSAGSIPPPHHRGHDLLLATVYVYYRTNRPNEWRRWVGEDVLPIADKGIKNPDAFLLDASGQPCRVIESAGRYSLGQIEAFHQYCQQNALPYELW